MKETKIKIPGFQPLNGNLGYRPYTLNIALFGPEGAGKSRFIATCPGPIGGIILDMKSEVSIRRAQEEFGKEILLPPSDVTQDFIHDLELKKIRQWVNEASSSDEKKAKAAKADFQEHYERRVAMMEDLLMELVGSKQIKTVFVDSFYQLTMESKWAVQGPRQQMKRIDSGKVFQDNDSWYQRLIKLLNRINVKHTILTHKWKDEYYNDAKTGRMTWEGFKYLGNHTNCVLELTRNLKPKLSKDDWRYKLNVRNCLLNETLQGPDGQADETGLIDDAISFENLARAIFTDVDDEVFEREFV